MRAQGALPQQPHGGLWLPVGRRVPPRRPPSELRTACSRREGPDLPYTRHPGTDPLARHPTPAPPAARGPGGARRRLGRWPAHGGGQAAPPFPRGRPTPAPSPRPGPARRGGSQDPACPTHPGSGAAAAAPAASPPTALTEGRPGPRRATAADPEVLAASCPGSRRRRAGA